MPKSDPQTTPDLAVIHRAIAALQQVADAPKKFTITDAMYKQIEQIATIKDASCTEHKMMGIPFIVNPALPEHLMLMETTSGETLVFDLQTGRCGRVPKPKHKPPEFEHRRYGYPESRHFNANPWWPND